MSKTYHLPPPMGWRDELLERIKKLEATLKSKTKDVGGLIKSFEIVASWVDAACKQGDYFRLGEYEKIKAAIQSIEDDIPPDDDGSGGDDESLISPSNEIVSPKLIQPKPPKSDSPGIS